MNWKTAVPLFVAVAVAVATVAACGSGGASASAPDSGAASPDTGMTIVHLDAGFPDAADATAAHDAGGASDSGSPTDSGVPSMPGADASIVAFNQTLICFGSGGVGPCSRTVDTQTSFPTSGTFSQITLHVTLDCPSNGCDPWDRVGSIALVTTPNGPDAGVETLTELGRFITPYGINAGVNAPPAWDIDVTELRPLLSGTVTLRAFIDTWVPQGNAAAYGGGWVLGATFDLIGGMPAKEPVAVVPIWVWTTTGQGADASGLRRPDATHLQQPSAADRDAPRRRATSFGVRSTITGHGQGNLDNCSEFCSENHTWQVATTPNTAAVWRTDCANYPSNGTYMYSRAGLVPGRLRHPLGLRRDLAGGRRPLGRRWPTRCRPTSTPATAAAPDGGFCAGCQAGRELHLRRQRPYAAVLLRAGLLIGFR